MVIAGHVAITNNTIIHNGVSVPAMQEAEPWTPETVYTLLQCNYPKFYKMDKLCKWAVIAAHGMFSGNSLLASVDNGKVAIALATAHGCLDVDTRYHNSIAMPSPALFVYTLPNIMLGEICIRYGFKGEQLCMVSHAFDAQELFFSAQSLMSQGMQACLTGWVDVANDTPDAHLFWITKNGSGTPCTAAALQRLYDAAASK